MTDHAELERILEGCKAGQAAGFEALVDRYASSLYRYFFRLTGDAATSEDLLGELFVKLVRKIGSCRGDNFEAWLFKTASNVFHDHLRTVARRRRLLRAEAEQLKPNPAAPDRGPELADELQVCLERLDTDTRDLIVMRYYGQLSFKELAAIRGEPIGTTLAKVHRGLKKLRELMEP